MNDINLSEESAPPPPLPDLVTEQDALEIIADILAGPEATEAVRLRAAVEAPAVLERRLARGDFAACRYDPDALDLNERLVRIDPRHWLGSAGQAELAAGGSHAGCGGMLDPVRFRHLYIERRGLLAYRVVADRHRPVAAELGRKLDEVIAVGMAAAGLVLDNNAR